MLVCTYNANLFTKQADLVNEKTIIYPDESESKGNIIFELNNSN